MKITVQELIDSRNALETLCASPKFPRPLGFKLGVLKRKGINPIFDELEVNRQKLLGPLNEARDMDEKNKDNKEWKPLYPDAKVVADAAWEELTAVEEELQDVKIPLSTMFEVEISPTMLGLLDWLIVDDIQQP